ncbi:MAG: hypothetical protein AB7I04_08750 [Pseudomonadales bacterium]
MNGNDQEPDRNRAVDAGAEDRLVELTRESLGNVDPAVAARLAAMRREAVAMAEDAAFNPTWLDRLFAPGGLAAAGAVLGLTVAAWIALRPTDDSLVLPVLAESEIAVVQELELLEELEFLAWLEEEEIDGAG